MSSPKERSENIGDFPTVLIAELEETVSSALCTSLQNEGVNVLVTHDWTTTFNLIKSHSRPIHLLLTNVRRPDLAEMLKPYRTELRILFIAQHPSEIRPNVLHPDTAVGKIQELLKARQQHPH